MKKKLLLIIAMFMFIANVNALTFNIDITNIEDKGNNGTIGSIENIDVANKELDVLFQDIGDEVNFEITVTNTGDRAGTLRNITFESSNDKIEYTSNLPTGGLAINGNDTNKVTITAKVLAGATNGKTTSNVKLKYTYDEGSCPEGEILSPDESQCLCPEGKVRNEQGICVEPVKPIQCKDGEIYNEQKKICEKKVVPSNPKTLDNIVLITLLFIVSGLGIYAVMFKKLKTSKQKKVVGVVTGVITLILSFVTLTSIFGLDNLLGAIINPITKEKELIVKVNEKIELIETWDGNCDLDVADLTPSNIFQGGSGTQADPYQIKTAEQLSCFAKSVNNGTTYEGKYIKQIKHIKLNDHLNETIAGGTTVGLHVWTPAGYGNWNTAIATFNGTYDGDNHIVSGVYLTDASRLNQNAYMGFIGFATNATFKNLTLSDVYMNTSGNTGAFLGCTVGNLTIDNVKTYGKGDLGNWGSGLIVYTVMNQDSIVSITNTETNVDIECNGSCAGFVKEIYRSSRYDEPTDSDIIFRNDINNGKIKLVGRNSYTGGIIGDISTGFKTKVSIDNCENNGDIEFTAASDGNSYTGGIAAGIDSKSTTITNSRNHGNFTNMFNNDHVGGIAGDIMSAEIVIRDSYNSGDIVSERFGSYNSPYAAGIVAGTRNANEEITNCYNTGDIAISNNHVAGIIGSTAYSTGSRITNCFNTGNLKGNAYTGGIAGEAQVSGGGRIVENCYNTGTIEVSNIVRGGGIIGFGSAYVENCYNEGDIIVTSTTKYGEIGGICPDDCPSVKNSYNRGNIIVQTTDSAASIGGINGRISQSAGVEGIVTNVYNSGNLSCPNSSSCTLGGISGWNGTVSHAYNLGNISVNQTGTGGTFRLSGISFDGVENCVNKGNISLKLTTPFTTASSIYMFGISVSGDSNRSFNAGTITLDDLDLPTPAASDGYSDIYIGEIQNGYKTTSRINNFSNTTGFALGCYQRGECTLEESNAVGISTEDSAPSILSIINGDGAFNDDLDEHGLPTLKVFN